MHGPSPHLSVDRVRIFAWTKSAFRCGSVNHATSPKLYQSYYLHRSRELVSPVCGIFFYLFALLVDPQNKEQFFFFFIVTVPITLCFQKNLFYGTFFFTLARIYAYLVVPHKISMNRILLCTLSLGTKRYKKNALFSVQFKNK